MKKNTSLIMIFVLTFMIFIGSNCYAAWWGTPGYEWALSRGLTSIKTQSQLDRTVTLSDYYNVILKYLKMKNVQPKKNVTAQGLYVDGIYNGTIEGLIKDVNSYIGVNQKSLTPQQYRNLEELIEHAKKTMDEQSNLLYRDDLKDLNLYLDLAKYRGATLLESDTKIKNEYKKGVLYRLRNTKYASSLNYGIMPMCGEPTRGSFLVLMHNLISDTSASKDEIIKSFNEAGVLLGYDNDLWLNESLRYSEMLTFLYRFEAYDFSSTEE